MMWLLGGESRPTHNTGPLPKMVAAIEATGGKRFGEFGLTFQRMHVTDDMVLRVVARFPELVELNLGACGNISDVSIRKVVQGACPQLQELSLRQVSSARVARRPSSSPPPPPPPPSFWCHRLFIVIHPSPGGFAPRVISTAPSSLLPDGWSRAGAATG